MLESDPIRLRLTQPEDAATRHAWFNDPDFTRLYLGRPAALRYKQVEEEVLLACQPTAASGLAELAIEIPTANRYIGNAFFRRIDWQDRNAEFGIFIGPHEYWGKGLGSETARRMLSYGFQELGLHRIWLTVFPFNPRAVRCFEKCGFKREGIFRETVYSGGVFQDVIGMSILDREYQSSQ
jgi:RimJ/RimL family protein N-acetyltransferase